jgi:aromatic-L-amino-acid decarboxylase
VIGGGLPFAERGIELTRSFRALKVWMSLKAEGVAKYARLIEQNVAQARYLSERILGEPEMELLAPVALNVVCFRFRADGMDEAGLNALNKELLLRIQESGAAVLSSTVLDGKFALRVAITNHRSRREDFDLLVDATKKLGAELMAEVAKPSY